MILRSLPAEVLAADISEFEGTGAAATEIGLPMNTVLNQLPSGKVEMTLQELVPHIPAGYLKPAEQLAPHLATLVSLPLMDVVMRIPPDLLAVRPDQKDVDPSVINMADPFTEEAMREQAVSAGRSQMPSQPNIIDEHQVPATEEFVPRDQANASRTFVPPSRPLAGNSIAKTSGLGTAYPKAQFSPPPSAPTAPGGTVIMPAVVRNSSPVPPPAPNATSRRISPSGRLPSPIRSTTPMPVRAQAAPTAPVALSSPPSPDTGAPRLAPPFPGAVNRPTAPLPTPPRIGGPGPSPQTPQPLLRPTVALPTIKPVAPSEPVESAIAPAKAPEPSKPAAPAGAFPLPGQPDAAADELKRLAALAMEQEAGEAKSETAALVEAPPLPQDSPASPERAESSPPAEPIAPPAPVAPPEKANEAPPALPISEKKEAPVAEQPQEKAAIEPALALNLNNCGTDDLLKIPGCSPALAEAIVRHRAKIGSFKKMEDLLEVPGMNTSAYRNLTGEAPPQSGVPQSLSDLLGFPEEQKVTLKDVTDRICCWPDVTGCILGQSSGLSLVGTVPKNFDKAAIVAFAPRMFESINKSFSEIAGRETNELIIPTTGTSFNILRNGDLYLIILCRLPQMPDRHIKIARLVLAGLNMLPA